ncbi:hypothetical protein EMCG_07790 [[Emmonsia] crescens]|uniref:Uncharacterized protein n=1 Tax=[Emmonsia] crescens TaxID=73230 RepID=A0A0G2J566_9EURO|nr:hypothetical protein EMCG_07790 [Emmonsia crescens UAMH 3008]
MMKLSKNHKFYTASLIRKVMKLTVLSILVLSLLLLYTSLSTISAILKQWPKLTCQDMKMLTQGQNARVSIIDVSKADQNEIFSVQDILRKDPLSSDITLEYKLLEISEIHHDIGSVLQIKDIKFFTYNCNSLHSHLRDSSTKVDKAEEDEEPLRSIILFALLCLHLAAPFSPRCFVLSVSLISVQLAFSSISGADSLVQPLLCPIYIASYITAIPVPPCTITNTSSAQLSSFQHLITQTQRLQAKSVPDCSTQ